MKKSLLILFIFAAILAPAVSAQGNESGSESARERRNVLLESVLKRQENRGLFLNEIKAKREEAKELFKLRREEFKNRLEEINDERKRMIVENIDLRLASINKKSTDQMTKALTRLEELLAILIEKTEDAKTEGMDTTTVDNAITNARSAITEAKETVTMQAGKEYIADISSEENIGSAVSTTVQALRNDLKDTYLIVRNAKQKVREVASALKTLYSISPAPTNAATTTIAPEPSI